MDGDAPLPRYIPRIIQLRTGGDGGDGIGEGTEVPEMAVLVHTMHKFV